MQAGAITHHLEPVYFLNDLRCAGYRVYPTIRGVLLCPPDGRTVPMETRITLFRTMPYLRQMLIEEGEPVLSDDEAAFLAGDLSAGFPRQDSRAAGEHQYLCAALTR